MSAEFLKRTREKFLRTSDRALRIGSVVSVGFAPYAPVFSPEKEAQGVNDQRYNLAVSTPLSLNGAPKTLEAPDGRRVIFTSPEAKEQQEKGNVWFGGIWARFNDRGQIIISTPWNKTERVHLEPYTPGGIRVLSLSPDGKKIAVALHSVIGTKSYPQVFVLDTLIGEGDLLFSPELIVRGMTSASFSWSADSQKVAAIVTNFDGKKEVGIFHAGTGEMLTNPRDIIWGEFSPDANWFTVRKGKDIKLINLQSGGERTVENVSRFSWSKDSGLLVLTECGEWSQPRNFPADCIQGQLALYNHTEDKRISLGVRLAAGDTPLISPDNTRILAASLTTQGFGVLDLRDGRTIPIRFPRNFSTDQFSWDVSFWSNNRILFKKLSRVPGDPNLIWVDALTGEVKARQSISLTRGEAGRVVAVFLDYVISEITDIRRQGSRLYLHEVSPEVDVDFRGKEVVSLDDALGPFRDSFVFGIIKDGEQFTAKRGNFLFQGNKIYQIKNEEARQYLGGETRDFPEVLANFIPEGEKISFRPGDVVGHKDLGIWYLRNGKRYKVQNWDWFTTRLRYRDWQIPRHPNAPTARLIGSEIISQIPVGQIPEPPPSRQGIIDWDEKEKRYQPYGGRMIVFMGGYNGSSAGQLEAFHDIKAKLLQRGWRESHFLDASYNIDQQLLRAGVILPRPYESAHTSLHPSFHISHLDLQLKRYKEMFPLTKFILIGHSLGGFTAFNAALRHTDAIDTIITIDSPIKGIDRSFYTLDRIIGFFGESVGSYLVEIGDNPATEQEVEGNAHQLRCRGARIFTFTNEWDKFIPPAVATLNDPYQDEECPGEQTRMVWDLGIERDDVWGHSKALYDPRILDTITMLIPPSEP